MPRTRPFPYAELHLQYCVSFVTDEMLYEFRHIKLTHIPSPGSQMSAITPIDSHCQRFQMWKFFTSLVERFDRTIILKLKNMKFVLFIVATLSHIIDIRLIHCIVLCDIHMTFQLTINQTESVGFGNRFNNLKIILEHTENLLTHPYNIARFFIGHFVKNDTSLQ